jgi:hypothetical protein
MTEPIWRSPPRACSLIQPPPTKHKREVDSLDTPSPLGGFLGLSTSSHALPPAPTSTSSTSTTRPAGHVDYHSISDSTSSVSVPGPSSLAFRSLSLHLLLLSIWLNVPGPSLGHNTSIVSTAPPVAVALSLQPAPIASGPTKPSTAETPDFVDGGWTYIGPPLCTKAEKNKAKKG